MGRSRLGLAIAVPLVGTLAFWLAALWVLRSADQNLLTVLSNEHAVERTGEVATDVAGYATVVQLLNLDEPWVTQGYWLSIRIGLVVAGIGGLLSLLVAPMLLRSKQWPFPQQPLFWYIRAVCWLLGVGLALACATVLSRLGLVAQALDALGLSVERFGITPGVFWGLSLIYATLHAPVVLLLCIAFPCSGSYQQRPADPRASEGYWSLMARPAIVAALLATTLFLFGSTLVVQTATCAGYGCALSNLPYLLVDEQRTGDVPANALLGYALTLRLLLTATCVVAVAIGLQLLSERGKAALTRSLFGGVNRLLRALVWLLR